jgi:LEA14-like dessication related protein
MKTSFIRLSFISLLLFLTSCSLVQVVKIKGVSDVSPRLENKDIYLEAKLQVENANFFAIKVKQSNLKISIDDKELGALLLEEKILFKRKSDTIYPIKLKVKLADGAMFLMLRNAFKKEITLKIKGTVKGSALGIPKTIQVDEVKTIDASLLKLFGN